MSNRLDTSLKSLISPVKTEYIYPPQRDGKMREKYIGGVFAGLRNADPPVRRTASMDNPTLRQKHELGRTSGKLKNIKSVAPLPQF